MIEINVFLCPWLPRGLLNNNSTALRMLLPAFWCCDKNKSDLYEIILMVWEVSAVLPIWFIICFRTNGSRSYYYCTFLKWARHSNTGWRKRNLKTQNSSNSVRKYTEVIAVFLCMSQNFPGISAHDCWSAKQKVKGKKDQGRWLDSVWWKTGWKINSKIKIDFGLYTRLTVSTSP